MNYFVKAGKIIKAFWRKRLPVFFQKSKRAEQRAAGLENTLGKLLGLTFPTVGAVPTPSQSFRNREFKVYSQDGEDGLLLHIFSQIGVSNHLFAEVAAGDGRVCNTANLSLNFGWQGLLVDGERKNTAIAKEYYRRKLGQESGRVKIINRFVDAENINQLFNENGLSGEIDLFSIDVDGIDYWLWRVVNVVASRVVVIEYNASLGRNRAVTVPYEPDFRRYKKHASGWYHGASLLALAKLGEQKGYDLVGCSSSGVNAFFVKQPLATSKLAILSPAEAYYPHASRSRIATTEEQFAKISRLPFEEV